MSSQWLSLATIGQLLGGGRNEGIRVRGWAGVFNVLLISLTFAGAVFVITVLKDVMQGKPIYLSPVSVLAIVSGSFWTARLITKYVFHPRSAVAASASRKALIVTVSSVTSWAI